MEAVVKSVEDGSTTTRILFALFIKFISLRAEELSKRFDLVSLMLKDTFPPNVFNFTNSVASATVAAVVSVTPLEALIKSESAAATFDA